VASKKNSTISLPAERNNEREERLTCMTQWKVLHSEREKEREISSSSVATENRKSAWTPKEDSLTQGNRGAWLRVFSCCRKGKTRGEGGKGEKNGRKSEGKLEGHRERALF